MKPLLPSISILVMSYNQEEFIGACVDSVLSQEYEGELEFIFCDDNSSDSTFKIIEDKVYHYTGNRRVVTHRAEKNGKVATNMNIAVKLAKYDWLMRVDGDDILHSDRARISAMAILKHPNAVCVAGGLIPFFDIAKPVSNPVSQDIIFQAYRHGDFTERNAPPGLSWWGGTMCINRRVFDIFGDLHKDCSVLDDTVFATRSLMLGDIVIAKNATFLYYRRHGGNISSSADIQSNNIFELMKSDASMRNYYQKSIPAHDIILNEIKNYTSEYPEYSILYSYFTNHFNELKRQAFFWNKSWGERIADAKIQGPFWRKIPWALRVMCPFTYALAAKYMKKS